MGDELEDLRAVESKQGLALQGLQQAAAEAEERQKSFHAELLEMIALLKTNREKEAQPKSGGEQRLPTADIAGRDAVSPSLDRSDDGTGSRMEKRGGAAGADPTGGQLGSREQVWGFGPSVKLRSRPFLGQPKMAIPVLKGKGNFDTFSKQVRVCKATWIGVSLRQKDPYVEVGADGNENPSWPREYRPRCTKGNLWPGCSSFKPCSRMLTKQFSTVARLPGSVGNRYKIGTTPKPMPKREFACGSSTASKSGRKMTR